MSARFNRIGASLVVLLSAALIPAAAQMGAKGSVKGKDFDAAAAEQARRYLEEGRETFRFDTFGSEDFWGGKLKLHEAIAGEKLGGVGPGLSPEKALELGLKVDINAIPEDVAAALGKGEVDLTDPASTLVLLQGQCRCRRDRLLLRGRKDADFGRHPVCACAIRRSTTPTRPVSGKGWTAGPTATSTSARSWRWRLTSLPSPRCCRYPKRR